jgi:hypothetical protein
MRQKEKLLLFPILIIAITLACGPSVAGPEPKGDLPLDTMVALTINAANLSATATQAFAQANQPPQPPPPDPNQPPQPPPADTEPPPTDPPPAPTPTATNTPIPTLSPTDPKQGLGSPDWKKEFNSESDWHTYDTAGDRAEIKNGKLFFTMDDTIDYSIWTYAAPRITDYYLEIVATTPAACSGKDRYGLIIQTPSDSYTEGYWFHVACDGGYKFSRWNGSKSTTLISWGTNPAINSGPNQTNRLGIMKNGKQFGIYINGVLLGEVEDNTYIGEGKFGVIVHAANTSNFTIAYDDAAYWKLP